MEEELWGAGIPIAAPQGHHCCPMGLGACPQGHTWRSRVEWSPPHLPEEVPRVHPKGTLVWGSRQESLHPDIPLLPPTQCRQGLGGGKGGRLGVLLSLSPALCWGRTCRPPKVGGKTWPLSPAVNPSERGQPGRKTKGSAGPERGDVGGMGSTGGMEGGYGGHRARPAGKGCKGQCGGHAPAVCLHMCMRVCTPAVCLQWNACACVHTPAVCVHTSSVLAMECMCMSVCMHWLCACTGGVCIHTSYVFAHGVCVCMCMHVLACVLTQECVSVCACTSCMLAQEHVCAHQLCPCNDGHVHMCVHALVVRLHGSVHVCARTSWVLVQERARVCMHLLGACTGISVSVRAGSRSAGHVCAHVCACVCSCVHAPGEDGHPRANPKQAPLAPQHPWVGGWGGPAGSRGPLHSPASEPGSSLYL